MLTHSTPGYFENTTPKLDWCGRDDEQFINNSILLDTVCMHLTVGKRNYFTDYGILLHELPVVAVLFTQKQ